MQYSPLRLDSFYAHAYAQTMIDVWNLSIAITYVTFASYVLCMAFILSKNATMLLRSLLRAHVLLERVNFMFET